MAKKVARKKTEDKQEVQAKMVCEKVFEASRRWTSKDELKIPVLREIRSAAAQCLGHSTRKPKRVFH